MAQIIKEITVDVMKRNLFQAIIAKQHDQNSRFLKVTITNESETIRVEANSVVTINAKRADNLAKPFAGKVNEDGTVTVPLTPWMLELDDLVKCDITVIDSESRKLTTTSFELEVETAAYDDSEITEDENYDLLVSLLDGVSKVTSECQGVTQRAELAAANAEDATTQALDAADKAKEAAAHPPTVSLNGYWMLWDAVEEMYIETSFSAIGQNGGTNGITPHIGDNGNWFIGETDTGMPSRGEVGPTGVHVGPDAPEDDAVHVWVDTDEDSNAELPSGGDGGYYTPVVTQTEPGKAEFSWIASKDGMPDIASQSVTLPQGKPGKSAYQYALDGGYTGTEEEFAEKLAAESVIPRIELSDSVTTIEPNKFYVFPEMASLSITFGGEQDKEIIQEYKFRFISGATATTLTLPESVVGDITVDANSVVEVSIVDHYAVSQSWAVSE